MFKTDAQVYRYNSMLDKCKAYEDSLNRIYQKAEKDLTERLQRISDRVNQRL